MFHPRALTVRSDRGLRGPRHSGRMFGKFPSHSPTPVVFLPPLPCDLFTQLHRYRLRCLSWVVQRSPLHRSTAQESSPSTFRCLRGGVCLALSRDPPSFRPRRFNGLAGLLLLHATGLTPGPDPGVRRVSLGFGSRLRLVPRRAFLPFEALLSAARCAPRSRDGRGGSSPLSLPTRFTEPLPSSFLPAALSRTRRNLEGFLVLRSRTPVRRFQRRSAVAPVGLSIL